MLDDDVLADRDLGMRVAAWCRALAAAEADGRDDAAALAREALDNLLGDAKTPASRPASTGLGEGGEV